MCLMKGEKGMKFSEKIDKLLIDNNIKNLRKLAEEVDIPYTTLWDYYSSQTRLEKANLSYIKKIAKRLGCTVDYLAYDDIEVPTNIDSPLKNPISEKCAMLFDKIGDLSPEKQQIIMNVTESVMKEIDNENI